MSLVATMPFSSLAKNVSVGIATSLPPSGLFATVGSLDAAAGLLDAR